jgi:hypothetical protein
MDDITQPIGPPVPQRRASRRRPAGLPAAAHGAGRRRRPGPAGGRAGLGRRAARPRSRAGRQEGVFALSNPGHLLAGIGIALVAVGLAGALATLVLEARGGGRARRRPGSASPAPPSVLALAAGADRGVGGRRRWPHRRPGGRRPCPRRRGGRGRGRRRGRSGDAGARPRAEPAPGGRGQRRPAGQGRGPVEGVGGRCRALARPGGRGRGRLPVQDGTRPARSARPVPARPNPAWRADGRVLDPARPETLVYWNGPGDRLTLVGVMYTRGPEGARPHRWRADHPLARPRVLPGPRHPGQAGPARRRRLPPGQVYRAAAR